MFQPPVQDVAPHLTVEVQHHHGIIIPVITDPHHQHIVTAQALLVIIVQLHQAIVDLQFLRTVVQLHQANVDLQYLHTVVHQCPIIVMHHLFPIIVLLGCQLEPGHLCPACDEELPVLHHTFHLQEPGHPPQILQPLSQEMILQALIQKVVDSQMLTGGVAQENQVWSHWYVGDGLGNEEILTTWVLTAMRLSLLHR